VASQDADREETSGSHADDGAPETRQERVLRWLETVGMWSLGLPFLLAGLVIVVLGPGVAASQLAEWAASKDVLALEVAVATLLVALTIAGLWWAFARGGLVARLHTGRFEPILRASSLAFFAVGTFASLTGILHQEGAIEVNGGPVEQELFVDAAAEFYVWHLVDTVPLLDVADNLDWEQPFTFGDRVGGLLLIAFKGFVIFPLIQVARLILAGRRRGYEDGVLAALREQLPRKTITETYGRFGYDVAIVGKQRRVLVDVMRELWNEDAAIDRLQGVERLQAASLLEIDAYLLVTDAVSAWARERIEAAFSKAALPAKLVVWRADQRPAALSGELKRLRAEAERQNDDHRSASTDG
jgi:hypothetical protein